MANRVPSWISSWLLLPDLELTAQLHHRHGTWDLRGLKARSGAVSGRGRWRWTPEGVRAALLIERGRLQIGLAFSDDQVEVQFVNADEWLREELAEFPLLSGAATPANTKR